MTNYMRAFGLLGALGVVHLVLTACSGGESMATAGPTGSTTGAGGAGSTSGSGDCQCAAPPTIVDVPCVKTPDGRGLATVGPGVVSRKAASFIGAQAYGVPIDGLEPVLGAGAVAYYSLPVGINDDSIVASCNVASQVVYKSVRFIIPPAN